VLALAIGAWPSVLVVSAVTAAAAWTQADSRRRPDLTREIATDAAG
jgi:hypothetical protein